MSAQINRVGIPSYHFARQVSNIYSRPWEAFVREVVQNSRDAGANVVKIVADENSVVVEDDGCGMSKEVLIQGMLTLSGSVKKEGDTGGFGAAKELILFAMNSYELHTHALLAMGECLEYMLDENADYFNGTRIKVVPHEALKYDKDEFLTQAKSLVSRCELGCEVTINGETVFQKYSGKVVRELDWCNIHVKDIAPLEVNRMQIRHNGLYMFSKSVPNNTKEVIIELKGNSTDVLTTNRDMLKWQYGDALDKVVQELTVDKNSFGKYFGKVVHYVAANPVKKVVKNMGIGAHSEEVQEQIISFFERVQKVKKENPELLDNIREMIASSEVAASHLSYEVAEQVIKEIEVEELKDNFLIKIEKKGIDEIPEKIDPSKGMKKKYKLLSLLWEECCMEAIRAGDVWKLIAGGRPTFGFILSDDVQACYEKKEDNKALYINPFSEDTANAMSDNEQLMRMLITACHEVAHSYTSWHDEDFCTYVEKIIVKTVSNTSLSAIRKEAKRRFIEE